MAGFSTRDGIVVTSAGTTTGKIDQFDFYKAGSTAQGAGTWHSLWPGAGRPGAGANPAASTGTAYSTDQSTATAGAMWFPDRSTDRRFLISFGCMATQTCTLMLYDRLVGVSGISVASTGAKTINSIAISDHYTGTSANLNEVWLEVTTATTTTAAVVNLNAYTTADGTTGQSGGNYTFPAAATVVNSLHQIPLNASKAGVRSVEAGLTVGTAASAGTVSVLIIRPLARISLVANVWNEVNFLDDIMGLPRIYDNATLALAFLPTVTTAPNFLGSIVSIYG